MVGRLLDYFKVQEVLRNNESIGLFEYKAKIKFDSNNIITSELYSELNQYLIDAKNDWSLEIEELDYNINHQKYIDLEIDEYDEEYTLAFTIYKRGERKMIYQEEKFQNFLNDNTLQEILEILKENSRPILLLNENFTGKSSSSLIGYNQDILLSPVNHNLSYQCYFYNYSDFKFSPQDFEFIGDEDNITMYFKRVYFIFILIYLFDVSEIKEDSLILKLTGNKTFNYTLDFNNLDISSIENYKLIYTWVYSEKEKTEEKIGIARNILSLYLSAEHINIDKKVYHSILSANQLYIKENVSKFIETRDNIFKQLDTINDDINSSLNSFSGNFSKSLIVFVTFYLSVFILKVFEKVDINSALSKEETFTGIGFLALFLMYFIFSLVILNLDKNRIYKKYETLKERFINILGKDQVDSILEEDKEFKEGTRFFRKRRTSIIVIWCITLIVLTTILFSTSDYINFKYIHDNSSSTKSKGELLNHKGLFNHRLTNLKHINY
ncbi:hypothetical protein M2T92_12730 [Elizabethkingia miricola]|uniref:hypothetical protein n=1 Tax=Elizabethkingia miricola TaxID=172045 RepID=UPI0020129CBC|nr:hypothetical protein [Elizabethkingia miricola]MCL1679893.1 hypothetical protein [Elizabethkingia miricola]